MDAPTLDRLLFISDAAENIAPDLLTKADIVQNAIDLFTQVGLGTPRVAILSTGNEIVEPGSPLGPGQIYDINRFTLSSVIRAHGGIAAPRPTAPDSLPELMAAVQAAATDDVIVFSGGSSVGERDLIMDALASLGEVIFHGIAAAVEHDRGAGRFQPAFHLPSIWKWHLLQQRRPVLRGGGAERQAALEGAPQLRNAD